MCLAILKPAGKTLPEAHIRDGWIGNPDGGGYGFVDAEGNVVVKKGFRKLKEFVDSYKKDEEANKDTPFLVHFRICTMGAKDEHNTHPFNIEDGILIHNGTIGGTAAEYGKGKSDTALFAEAFGKDLTFDFVYTNKLPLEQALSYNKIALLFKDKRWIILNDKEGIWDDDIWYSNRAYKGGYGSAYPYMGDDDYV